MPIQRTKQSIREKFRQNRQTISAKQALLASQSVVTHLKNAFFYPAVQRVACFWSFDGEINTQPIFAQLFADKKQCYLPKLRPFKPNRLWFLPYNGQSPLMSNRYGIPEVDLAANCAARISSLDLIILPLVAFDGQGNRLGMGGGYYDATLAHLSDLKNRPLCLGLAYESQHYPSLPSEPWDFQLDGVLTEQQLHWIK